MGVKLFSPRHALDGPETREESAVPQVSGVRSDAQRNGSGLASVARSAPQPPLREAAALLLFTGAAFLALALATFRADPFDPSIHGPDWVGPVGASVAGILVQGFGIVAWLAPLEIALIAAPLFRGQRHINLGLRLAGDLLVSIVTAALVQVAAPEAVTFGSASAAGNVGLLFGELMRELFSTLGSFLVGLTIIGLILIGRSSFSFIVWFGRTLELLRALSLRLSAAVRKLAIAWGEARALRKAERQALKAASAPRIETGHDEASVLLELEDDSDWAPMEHTGPPPLSISAALRDGLGISRAEVEEQVAHGALKKMPPVELAETPEPAPVAPVAQASEAEPRASEPKTRRRRKADKAAFSLELPAEDDETEASAKAPPVEAKAEARPSAAKAATEARPSTVNADPEPRIVDTKPALEVERPKQAPRPAKRGDYQLPTADLLYPSPPTTTELDRDKILEHAARLEKTLSDYGVIAKVEEIHPGPTVTTYEVACEAGTKVSKVASLADDLALGLSRKVRIIAPIPGKSRIGFELPNDERIAVNLRELIEDQRFEKLAEKAPLPVVLGRDIVGAPFYADLASMPHVIVAGATGAGKSVGLNVMLSSLLFKRSPDELRMLMIDPKVVELAPFDGIPHMLLPVVTDMKQAATALRWAVDEMERRYQLFANAGTKNITTYNGWVKRVIAGDIPGPKIEEVQALSADGDVVNVPVAKEGTDGTQLPEKLPYIVIVVDEFADLMMQQGKEVEVSVARLAQKARAAGMHVVLATQRPSVDVITGMIKANFPSRIAFRVAQKVDSRTILDEQGAEWLLGRGDMLVKLNGGTDTRRVQCPFVSEEEVNGLTDFLRSQGTPEYNDAILLAADDEDSAEQEEEAQDARFEEAVRIVADTQRCSTSWLQRKMTIGYNRAAKIVEMMEKRGMVGPPNGARDREVLIHAH